MNEISLIKAMISKDDVILVRKPFVKLCQGHIQAAMMLSQILYWTDGKTKIHGRWIAKTSQQWREELFIGSDYEVKMARSTLEKLGIIETQVKKFNGNPTVHYRLNVDVFLNLLSKQIGFGEIQQNDSLEIDETITEITSETTNTASGENQPSATLPLDWQVAMGAKQIVMPDEKQQKIVDACNLLCMGTKLDRPIAYGIAYMFMTTRDIVIPESKIKGNRKALKSMIDSGVLPPHAEAATRKLMESGMTVVDLFSIEKTAIDLANQPETYTGIEERE